MAKESPLSRCGRTATVTLRVSPRLLASALFYLLGEGVVVRNKSDLVHRMFTAAVESLLTDEAEKDKVRIFPDDISAESYLTSYFAPSTIDLNLPRR